MAFVEVQAGGRSARGRRGSCRRPRRRARRSLTNVSDRVHDQVALERAAVAFHLRWSGTRPGAPAA